MDPIVKAILDSFFAVTGIDPAAVEPDERVIEDLKLIPDDVKRLIEGAIRETGINVDFAKSSFENLSLRQITEKFKASTAVKLAA